MALPWGISNSGGAGAERDAANGAAHAANGIRTGESGPRDPDRDVLAVDPDNQLALRALILSLTDQFSASGAAASAREARDHIVQLDDEYDRAYYTGIVYERETRAYLERKNVVRSAAYDGFRHAMEWYERAEALRPPGNVDAILRWNSCVRAIERERLEPAPAEPELPLE